MVLFDNFLYKLAALLMAVVLWATAQGFQSEEQSIDLPIALVDVPEDLVVVDQSSEELNLRIAGSRAAVRQAEKQLLRYTVSLSGGIHPRGVHAEANSHACSMVYSPPCIISPPIALAARCASMM